VGEISGQHKNNNTTKQRGGKNQSYHNNDDHVERPMPKLRLSSLMQPTVKFSVRHGRGWGCEKGGGVVKSGRWQRSAFPVKADPMDQKIGPL